MRLSCIRDQFLIMQLIGIIFFAETVPIRGKLAERGRRGL